ncbi:MAG: DUF4175 family protein, partial [Alphaproteobacteria bacterium]
LETASGFAHRPLAALRDRIAGGADDAIAAALWQAHRRRVAARLGAARAGWPRPHVAARDPLALRGLVALLVVVAFVLGGGGARERLQRALSPGTVVAAVPAGTLDIWITPPAYTGVAPLVPRPDAPGELVVPAGSTLLAQVGGGRGQPTLEVDAAATPFDAVDARSFRVSARIDAGSALRVVQDGKPLGAWALRVVPDALPVARFQAPPGSTRRSALKIDFEAEDDYGLASIVATLRRAERPEGVEDEEIELPLTLSEPGARESRGTGFHDLTAHPWAGLRVAVRLRATDTAGQHGLSEPAEIVLPERAFRNPVARAIVEQRKLLVSDPAAQRRGVAFALGAISGLPAGF